MPQLLMLAALGAGVYFGARWLGRKVEAIAAQGRRAAEAADNHTPAGNDGTSQHRRDDIPTLVQDPETGVYKIDGPN